MSPDRSPHLPESTRPPTPFAPHFRRVLHDAIVQRFALPAWTMLLAALMFASQDVVADVAASPDPRHFTEQLVGTTSTARTVTITNGTSSWVSIPQFNTTVTGPFALASHGCPSSPIPPWGSCAVSVTFSPQAAGLLTGVLRFEVAGLPSLQILSVGLSGDGVTSYSGPAVSFGPATLNFAATLYGSLSWIYSTTITNVGFSTLTLSAITLSSGEFLFHTNNCGASLAPQAACTVQVRFIPSATGNRSGYLQVASNASGSPHQLPFTGVGTAPNFAGVPITGGDAGMKGGDHISDGHNKRMYELITARRLPGEFDGIPVFLGNNPVGPGEGGGGPVRRDKDPCDDRAEVETDTKLASSDLDTGKQPALLVALADHGLNLASQDSEFALDPIHTGNGNKTHEQLDHAGAGDFPLTFSRTYNSFPFVSAQHVKQKFGPGWTSSWDRSVNVDTANTVAVTTRGDGKAYTFTKQANGTWSAGSLVLSELVEVVDGSGQRTGWTYAGRDKVVESFDSIGRLTKISLPTGGIYTLQYGVDGRLHKVFNPFGKYLEFEYSPEGRVQAMIDPAGGETLYGYDAMGRLVSVTFPDGRLRQYRYETPNQAFALSSIVDESAQVYA
ncbi:MAG: choice-of-anchor D domain-containing protein, partial [Burkholderiales bacterium]